MGFTWENRRGSSDLFDADALTAEAWRIADRVADYLLDRVKALTPVGSPPQGQGESDWIDSRGGRRPGTLKESWEKGAIVALGPDHVRVAVETFDPVAPHVEYPTRPHAIRARRPGGRLRFYQGGQVRFAAEVWHPGTQGSFMMTRALEETTAMLVPLMRTGLASAMRSDAA